MRLLRTLYYYYYYNSKGEAKGSIGEKGIPYEENFMWTVDMRCLYYLADRIE